MFKRANLDFSPSVRVSGSVFVMPSLFSLLSWIGENFLTPLILGTSLSNSGPSFWVSSWKILASIWAASRLLAAVTAWMSPVKWRLNSSMGMTCGDSNKFVSLLPTVLLLTETDWQTNTDLHSLIFFYIRLVFFIIIKFASVRLHLLFGFTTIRYWARITVHFIQSLPIICNIKNY